MRIYLPSRNACIPEELEWHFLYGGDARNARFRKKEIRAAAKKRCLEINNNKYALICALIDRIDLMNRFESYMCRSVFRALKYQTKDLINKDKLELAEMLVIAEEIAGRHCHYPDSYCAPSKAIALKKNQISFKCDDNEADGCEDCEYCDVTEPCLQSYNTWLARDLSRELCKDGSLRYGFLKEMMHLYTEPNQDYDFFYPEGTFEDEERNNYENSLEYYYDEIVEDEDDFDLEIVEDEDDFDLGL